MRSLFFVLAVVSTTACGGVQQARDDLNQMQSDSQAASDASWQAGVPKYEAFMAEPAPSITTFDEAYDYAKASMEKINETEQALSDAQLHGPEERSWRTHFMLGKMHHKMVLALAQSEKELPNDDEKNKLHQVIQPYAGAAVSHFAAPVPEGEGAAGIQAELTEAEQLKAEVQVLEARSEAINGGEIDISDR